MVPHGNCACYRGTHVPETEEYGVGSFVYRNHERPFHSERLQKTLPALFGHAEEDTEASADAEEGSAPSHGSILRSKGSIWLATMHDIIVSWASAGQQISMQPQQPWLCALTDEQKEGMQEENKAEMAEQLARTAERKYKDRESEIVIIGIAMDEAKIRGMLDAALLTDEEMKLEPSEWADWECPFIASWTGGEDEDEDEVDEGEAEAEDDDDEGDAAVSGAGI